MKASDSVNSLTELTVDEKTCFICLETHHESGEPLVDSKLLRTCGCVFAVHPTCWNAWLKGKSDYDCPICRKASLLRIKVPPNPVMNLVYEEERRPRYPAMPIAICCGVSVLASILLTAVILWG